MKYIFTLMLAANLMWTWGYAAIKKADTSGIRKGTETGNGGDVRVCFNSKSTKEIVEQILRRNIKEGMREDPFSESVLRDIQSVELLDLYLLSRKSGGKVAAIQGTEEQIIQDRLALLESKSQFIYEILDAKKQIDLGGWYSAESGVLEIDDSGDPINYSDNCILVQLAYQDRISNAITRVFYDDRILNLMPALHRAAFKFHEWIYHIAIDRGYTDSRAVQDIVGIIFDEKFSTIIPILLNRRVADLKLSQYRIVILDDYNMYYTHSDDSEVLVYPVKLRIKGNEYEACDRIRAIGKTTIEFRLCGAKPVAWREFSGVLADGSVTKIDLNSGNPLGGNFEKGAKWRGFSFEGYISFYKNGDVSDGLLSQPALVGVNTIGNDYRLFFNENGNVTRIDDNSKSKSIVLQLRSGAMISCSLYLIDRYVSLYPKTGDVLSCNVNRRPILNGVIYEIGELVFHENGFVKNGKLEETAVVQGVTCGTGEMIEFYKSQKIKSCKMYHAQEHYLGQSQERLEFDSGSADFYEEGGVHCATLSDSFWSTTFILQGKIWSYGTQMCFYKDGKIESGVLGKSVTTSDGRVFKKYSRVDLNPEGEIIGVDR